MSVEGDLLVQLASDAHQREQKKYLLGSGSLGNSQRDAEDGIGAQLTLVRGAVELVQELVDLWLVLDVEVGLDEGGADDLVDIGHGLGDTLSEPLGLVAIAELDSLVLT